MTERPIDQFNSNQIMVSAPYIPLQETMKILDLMQGRSEGGDEGIIAQYDSVFV